MKRSCLEFEEEGKKRKISEIEIGIGAKSKISVSVFFILCLIENEVRCCRGDKSRVCA